VEAGTAIAQARSRAQNTAVTAGAIGTLAIAAGAFTLDDARLATRIAAGFALAAWVSTLLILMIASGRAVAAGQDEAGAVNRTITIGIYCAIGASAFTMATAVLAFVFPGGPKKVELTVVLTPAGQRTVSSVCSLLTGKDEIAGKATENQLGKSVTPLQLSESTCRATQAAGRTITLMLKTPDVGAVITGG